MGLVAHQTDGIPVADELLLVTTGSMAGPSLAGAVLKASGGRWLTFQAVAGSLQIAGGLIGIWTWWYGVGPMKWGNQHSLRK